MMLQRTSFILLAGLPVMFSVRAEILRDFSVGEAFSYQGQQLLYREAHCQRSEGLEREVFYLDDQGEAIAYKSLDYRYGASTPAFSQHNYQTNEKTQVAFEQNNLRMIYQNADGVVEQKTLDMELQQVEAPIVVDAGFDGYIRQHWDSLVGGEDQRFRFTLPTRGQLVDLRVSASRCSYQPSTDQCFTLAMDNWLFRMLVDDIELGYNPETRRLTRYRGLSNIEDENGNGIDVDIRYSYSELPLEACSVEKNRLPGDSAEHTGHG